MSDQSTLSSNIAAISVRWPGDAGPVKKALNPGQAKGSIGRSGAAIFKRECDVRRS